MSKSKRKHAYTKERNNRGSNRISPNASYPSGIKDDEPFQVKMNLFPITIGLENVFSYHVTISPEIVNEKRRLDILETFIAKNNLSPFLVKENEITITKRLDEISDKIRKDDVDYEIGMTLIEEKDIKNDEQIQNESLNDILKHTGMMQIGRNFFREDEAIKLEKDRNLKILKGITSAIHTGKPAKSSGSETRNSQHNLQNLGKNEPGKDQNQNGQGSRTETFLELDLASKIMHKNPIYKEIQTMQNDRKNRKQIENELIGRHFYTVHNRNVYEIDGIDWDTKPSSTFLWVIKSQQPDGTTTTQETMISYSEYFNLKYGINLTDVNQPFIISTVKRGSRRNPEFMKVYIPTELAVLINLSEDEKGNFGLMKEVTQTTQYSPKDRHEEITEFVGNNEFKGQLAKWDMEIEDEMVTTEARKFPNVKIQIKNKTTDRLNWQRDLNQNGLLEPVPLVNWAIAYDTDVYENKITDLVKGLKLNAAALGIEMKEPKIYKWGDLEKILNDPSRKNQVKFQIVLSVAYGRSKTKYNRIKQVLNEKHGIPSQNMRIRSIERNRDSVIKNILAQMNSKAFRNPDKNDFTTGASWSIDESQTAIPENTMIVGIDVWHGFSGKSKSIAGIVASFDGGMHYLAEPLALNRISQEIITDLKPIIGKWIMEFKNVKGRFPENVIILRDGVGNSQMAELIRTEFNFEFGDLKIPDSEKPKLVVICANKRIRRRIFVEDPDSFEDTMSNPPVGTYVDGIANTEEFPNFYMVSHSTNQGTITPTHYSIILNESNLETKELLRIAFQLTHLYYNWPGGIRTPAPVEYAHKLAFFMGQTRIGKIHRNLQYTKYFL